MKVYAKKSFAWFIFPIELKIIIWWLKPLQNRVVLELAGISDAENNFVS